jgi:RNA polymerase sigma-70 factor, ECF subfamily
MQAHADADRDPLLCDDRRFVYAVARRIVRDEDAANDVTQDAMLLAFRHRATFRGDSQYRTWLYRITTTAALSHLRRARAWQRRCAAAATARELEAAPSLTPVEVLTLAQTRHDTTAAVVELSATYREILTLRFYQDCSEREAADALGLSTSAIKLRTHRAKKALRRRLVTAPTQSPDGRIHGSLPALVRSGREQSR